VEFRDASTARASGEAFLPAANALREIAQFCFEKGWWRLAPIFADRAADLALSGGPAIKRVWCSAETQAARAHRVAGDLADSLRRVDRVLAEARTSLSARDEVILHAGYVRADALHELGRNGEALAKIDAFAPIQTEVKGARHPDTLISDISTPIRSKVWGGTASHWQRLTLSPRSRPKLSARAIPTR
jgi:hypothetical protein